MKLVFAGLTLLTVAAVDARAQEGHDGHGRGEMARSGETSMMIAAGGVQLVTETCLSPIAKVIVIQTQNDTGAAHAGGGMGDGGMQGSGGMHGGGGGHGGGAKQGSPYARLGISPLGSIARTLAEASRCFRTLEADPALLALPGGDQPDFVLRVQVTAVRTVDPSLFERVATAARRYVARFIGEGQSTPRELATAEVSLELICPKQRRVAQHFTGKASGGGDDPADTPSSESTSRIADKNHVRMALAYARAQDAAVNLVRERPRLCD